MTLVRLTTQARRVEGGHLIGRANRFSTGRAVTALRPMGINLLPVGELDVSARNTTAWDDLFSPDQFLKVLGFARVSVCLGRDNYTDELAS